MEDVLFMEQDTDIDLGAEDIIGPAHALSDFLLAITMLQDGMSESVTPPFTED